MVVYIYSDEAIYGGLYGMSDCGVYEVNNLEEANEIGHEQAYDVVESYSSISDSYDYDDDDDMKALDESLQWVVWTIKPEILEKLGIDDLMSESARQDRDSFVDMYCGERID